MKKNRLFTPGPVMVPEEALLEMARPMEHHRTQWYRDLHKQLHDLLQYLFQTKATCLVVTGSGTAAMEGAIIGCCTQGHKALVAEGGKFGERWVKVCKTFGIDHTVLKIEWGHGATPAQIEKALAADPKIDAVIVVHSETSTASGSDVQGIARVTRGRGALLLVDGITAVGAIPVKMDEWGVDVYVTGSQKALMLPPGLAFAAVNDRAWERINSGSPHALYNDFRAYRKAMEKWDAPYTPAVSLVRGTLWTLQSIRKRSLEAIWAETAALAKATRSAAKAMGLQVYPADPVDSVTALCLPEGVDEPSLRKTMRETYGMHIAGGQDQLQGKIIRISHMGYVDAFDTLGVIAALEMALRAQGVKLTLGAGVSAALGVLAELFQSQRS